MSDMKNYDPKLSFEELGKTISKLGEKKANTKPWQLILLGILAGIYISIGGHLFLVALNEGAGKIVGGAVFAVGLILVVIAGAELFTGNVIMTVGAVTRHYSYRKLIRSWVFVYVGNFIGAIVYTWLVYRSGLFGSPTSLFGGVEEIGGIGQLASAIAVKKMALSFEASVIRGIFCNMLVILAVIMSAMAKDIVSKMLCCLAPVMAFVAIGFEHCVANMFLIPIGLFIQGASFPEHLSMWGNILPVTLGNIIGGVLILFIHPNRIRQIKNLLKRQRVS
ncbi:MAG: formate/nitrite transporter family protein [Spirochaetales bacterium]|uniref:Formate/nitrite transporter family protein n=1 Tax=Candidatus Thalassospirochaeta sargassi TaxID=3119039 RepID=A0AAJ1IEJ6_9SPIO|nr:formate/nitrite transporter family protein [Spirochaetales bacterium]